MNESGTSDLGAGSGSSVAISVEAEPQSSRRVRVSECSSPSAANVVIAAKKVGHSRDLLIDP